MRPFVRAAFAAAAVAAFSFAAEAASVDHIRSTGVAARLRSAAPGAKVIITGVPAGGEALSSIELERTEVWAPDAKIVVHKADGTTETLGRPNIRTFKGRVVGDPDSLVAVSLEEDGTVNGLVSASDRQFRFASAHRVRSAKRPSDATDTADAEAPIAIVEPDLGDAMADGETSWTCGVESTVVLPKLDRRKVKTDALQVRAESGDLAGASYQVKLALETDTELYAAFGSTGALTTYLTNLVNTASIIYQRDISTTLTIGHTAIYAGGTDPWAKTAADGTAALLAELGTQYATVDTADYKQVNRSAVVMISGKGTNGGVAWIDQLCSGDFYCGANGSSCNNGNPSPVYAGKYGGGYAYCGSFAGAITTTIPDPTLTLNGVQYAMPNTNPFWILAEFTHELGHVVASQHTHCVALTAEEQTLYGVTRGYVDICASGECYSGATSYPAEYGTIMSYCHNLFPGGGVRASRYLFGKAGEPSFKMLSILRTGDPGIGTSGLEGATPDPTITTQPAPLACVTGRTASVATCSGCTYSWQATGASITTAANINAITFTPFDTSVTLTVTITSAKGCGITVSKTVAASCTALTAPTDVLATSTGATTVSVQWAAVTGATGYQVFRRSLPGGFSPVGSPVAASPFTDTTAAANTAYVYLVRAQNAGGSSGDSVSDLATTAVFTDASLTAQSTTVKTAHFTELLAAVNAVRTVAGLGPIAFTAPAPTSPVTVRATHINDLRTALDAARAALGFSGLTYTDPTLSTQSTKIKAVHLSELRDGVK